MFKLTAAFVIVATTTIVMPGRLTAAPTNGHFVLRVYGTDGVAPATMSVAAETAVAIFNRAGMHLTWRDCELLNRSAPRGLACDQPLQPLELLVRITAAAGSTNDDVLGYSSVDVQRNSGSLATVLMDRIEGMAVRANADPGRLLGRVIAHEVGHLLLGSTRHSASGLMRARWLSDEMQRDSPLDWLLPGTDAGKMKRALAARSKSILQRSLIAATASDEWPPAAND